MTGVIPHPTHQIDFPVSDTKASIDQTWTIAYAPGCSEIKFAGEQVLRSFRYTVTEAMELFLRRPIVDQKMPFEVIALDGATFATNMSSWEVSKRENSI